MSGIPTPSKAEDWIFWEQGRCSAVLADGRRVELNPGDRVLVEYLESTGSVLSLLDHEERVLH